MIERVSIALLGVGECARALTVVEIKQFYNVMQITNEWSARNQRELCVHSFQNISRSSPMLCFGDPRPPSRRYVNSTFSSLTWIKMYYYILKSCVPFRFFRESVIDDLFLWKDIAVDSYDTLAFSSSFFATFLFCPAATQSIKQSFNQYQVSFLYSFFSSRARLHKRDLIISFQLLLQHSLSSALQWGQTAWNVMLGSQQQ